MSPDAHAVYLGVARGISHSGRRSSSSAKVSAGTRWSHRACLPSVNVAIDLKLGSTTELGRFPEIPYEIERTPAGLSRTPAVIAAHEAAKSTFQAELERRLVGASAQGSRGVRARVCEYVRRRCADDRRAVSFSRPRVRVHGLYVARWWYQRGVLRLRRRSRVGRVRGGGPQEDDSHGRRDLRSAKNPFACA